MKKALLLLMVFSFSFMNAQSDKFWKKHDVSKSKITTNAVSSRQSFPKQFDLYELNLDGLRNTLFASLNNKSSQKTIITLPNAYGQIEEFEMYEASNFDAELQARFPGIRAYSGKGITDKYATLKLSISPQGIQTMVFRTDKPNEFMEPYSSDNKIYAVYYSQRTKGALDWTCSTVEKEMVMDISDEIKKSNLTQRSSDSQLRTLRLAQSCTAEYANFFGATSSAQVGLVLAAFNNTLTRCNGVYEKDLGLHLNLISQSTNVIFYNAATDPYSPGSTGAGGAWSPELQSTLNTELSGPSTPQAVNDALYDIGHLFGATGGGGSAGCIGCACGTINPLATWTYIGNGKGSGFTSPGSGPPSGDNFDIDYVVHEVGHQLGMNHSFTHSSQVNAAQREVGSGVTIMGYAGITSYDVAPHSIDTYHAYNIYQFEANFADKPCTQVQSVSANNVAPVVNPVANYIIPISTPFILEGSATDVNGDALTYQWEQNDGISGQTGASSPASTTKASGPNFRSWLPTASPNRYMPNLTSVIANSATTNGTGNEVILVEALSSVARDLNFRLTVRDNAPYNSVTPEVGQTAYTDMKVTVDAAAGPFALSVPSATGLSYVVGTNQTVTWNVASTNTGAVNTPYVDIYLFVDNTLTNGILLASKVPNDGSEIVTIPNNVGTTHRIMVRGNGNVFFDISNNNFTIAAPASSFSVAFNGAVGEQNKGGCQMANAIVYTFNYTALSGFSGTTNFTATGVPANTIVTFSPTSRTTTGTVTMTVTTTATTTVGLSNIIVNATSGATTKTVPFYLEIAAAPGAASLSTPANNAVAQSTTLNLAWTAGAGATSYDIQVATDNTFTTIIASANVSGTTYALSGLSQATNYYWRVRSINAGCNGVYGASFKFTTGIVNCSNPASVNVPLTIVSIGKPTVNSTLDIPAGVSITDINVTMNISHTSVSDLIITLINPLGTQVILLDQACNANDDVNVTFDDSGSTLVCASGPAIGGTITPLQALSTFNGTSSAGTWTLRIKDNASSNGGTLNSWSLNVCNIQPALSNPEFELQNISLYPNPNKGHFTVKFDSASNNDVKINVHDVRGRQIFEKSYSNNGTFNQEIGLDNVQSGVYLVSIYDGAKKTVKRIIIE